MNVTKIKYNEKAGKVEVQWATLDGPRSDESTKHERESFDPPHPDFRDALRAIIPGVLKLLELPLGYQAGLSVRGITLAWLNDDEEGAVVTLLKEVSALQAPLVLNTPLFPFGAVHGLEERFFDKIRGEAREYLAGKRAQTDLFRDQAKDVKATVSMVAPDGSTTPEVPLKALEEAMERLTA